MNQDLISRQAAIDALSQYPFEKVVNCVSIIEELPSAQPVQWIPCSYGFKRTGCACCPYGKDFDDELKVLEQHEPNLCKAVTNIFHDSYEYTRQYREFRKEMENK